MLIDQEPCCSVDDDAAKNSKEWDEMTDAELKVALGRLVDKAQDGRQIQKELGSSITENDRRWSILTRHLCMGRLQRQEPDALKRASFKIAQYLAETNPILVRVAFEQLLEYCCSNFEDSFDALYQRVAAVVDFGRQLKLQKTNDQQVMVAEPFFKILQIQESTADNNIFRLAFRFAHFLSQIFSINDETFEVDDPIKDDIVARLFDENVTNQNDSDKGFELPCDELEDLCQRRAPRTVKAFMEGFRHKEDPVEILIAFECFGQFAPLNRSAIRAQSRQLLDTLLCLENHFHLANFSSKVNSCIVCVLESDLTQIPGFCQRICSVHGSVQRMQVVSCVGDLIHQICTGQNQLPEQLNEKSKNQGKKLPQTKEIGRIIRKSATLTTPTQKTRAITDIVDKILKPFMSAVLCMDLTRKPDPITISGILHLLYDLQQRQMTGFRRILDEYFLLLANARQLSDWTTRLRCAQCYAGLAQMASQVGEDRNEWADHFRGVDDWLTEMTKQSIRQSDRRQHVQLDEFQQSLSGFFGKLSI